jgi:hypothetical protein
MPEVTWTAALAWFGTLTAARTLGGLGGGAGFCWRWRRGKEGTDAHPGL